ncbi:MAG: cobalt-precorrin 5A hydrolase [Fusicatenibacter sp.]|nr:cobalt-precorrin 5A hydrolase [Lachnospiraceae bacterium]MDY2938259.1 cobalt-precorrin 5A hydrolase [Fusicatenibacter sp.]
MKIAIVSFTRNGCALNRLLTDKLIGHECEGYGMEAYGKEFGLRSISPTLKDWTGRMFEEKEAVLFLGATGIAVRSITPFVKNKKTDPAVLVADEQGKFVISLLSGHIGGANRLTEEVAGILGAIPVITTATDVQGKFAVDVFAVKNHCQIMEMDLAKEVSARIVDGKKVGFFTDFPVEGSIPEELMGSDSELGICISLSDTKMPFQRTLHLIPQIITVGIGCKKNTEETKLETALKNVLDKADISVKAVVGMASIDLKAGEQGILSMAERYHWNFTTYSKEELLNAEGEFTPSDFVRGITGVDNVCERSAVLQGGHLIWRKEAANGVTIALAESDWRAVF